jgi:hypothetical protein
LKSFCIAILLQIVQKISFELISTQHDNLSQRASELRGQRVATGQLAQKLAKAPARNPYTGQSFVWDASAKAVVFTGLEKGERGRHALFY